MRIVTGSTRLVHQGERFNLLFYVSWITWNILSSRSSSGM